MSADESRDARADGVPGNYVDPPYRSGDGTIRASVRIGPDSPWFSGHFPGEPILPGIAQLALVAETVQAVSPGRLRVAGMRRVRFKQVVKPDERLEISVTPPSVGRAGFAFRVVVQDAVVCSGTLDMV